MAKSNVVQAFIDEMAKEMFGWDGDEAHCKICNAQVNRADFIDELSIREYDISGMCQKCQDDFFGR